MFGPQMHKAASFEQLLGARAYVDFACQGRLCAADNVVEDGLPLGAGKRVQEVYSDGLIVGRAAGHTKGAVVTAASQGQT